MTSLHSLLHLMGILETVIFKMENKIDKLPVLP